jgi:hypothetical protein
MPRFLPCVITAVSLAALPVACPGAVQISEVIATNTTGIVDDDGAHSDWIELYNRGPEPVDLRGWHLTDDPARPRRWEFPSVVIPAGGFLVVFASGKDRTTVGSPLHTDFSLAAEGEFIALTDENGQEVDELAPPYPVMVPNISWGLLPGTLNSERAYFYNPTPGAGNDLSSRASDQPAISEASRTFTGSLMVSLSSPQQGALIFYTLDGSAPTAASLPYTGPLSITATTRLRAVAYAPGLPVSLTSGSYYLQLAADAVPANSNLPLMVLDNFSGGRPDNGTIAAWMIFEPDGALLRSSLTQEPAIASTAYIKVRGSSTATANKFSLAVEARTETGGDRDFPLLGLPADSDWVLTAPYEYDRALIRNPLMYQLSRDAGRYAPRTRQVELYLNTDGGPVSAADYFGVYTLTERIKRGSERINITELNALDNQHPTVSGGYLLKIDRADPGETGFTAGGQTLYFVDPDEPDITAAQRSWITAYINNWRAALLAPDFFDPVNGYAKWGDPAAFIDQHLLNVAAKNVDALRLSAYFTKDRLERLAPGPLWDFDRSIESTDGRDNTFNTWRGETGDLGTDFFRHTWYNEMFRDQNFWQQWIDRLDELRQGPLSNAAVEAAVDAQAAELTQAAARNFIRWSDRPPRYGGWAGEVASLRTWFVNRLNWIDSQFTRPPSANTPGGVISPGFILDLTSPSLTRPGAVIYYTTDGTDPRLFDETNGQQIITQTFIPLNHPVKVMLPLTDTGTAWRDSAAYDDSAWWSGSQGVGYDDESTYDPYIRFNLESPPPERRMKGVTQSCYLRYHFTATGEQIASLTFLKLRVRCDDGMAAWLNGVKLPVSIKEPALIAWNSSATSNTADSTAVQFTEFTIPNPQSLLVAGDNVLAVHGLNYLPSSSDFLIQLEMLGGYVPAEGPEAAPQALTWNGPLTINTTTHLIARTCDSAGPFTPWPYTGSGSGQTPVGSRWSAPLRLSLLAGTVPASADNLELVELMFHPAGMTPSEKAAGIDDRDEFEFLVLRNKGSQPVNLTGIHFTSGIDFTMPLGPQSVLAPGARGILVRNRAAFALRAVPGLNVLGQYRDKLSNGGEALTLRDAAGQVIFDFQWDDTPGWPTEADGEGFSLVCAGGTASLFHPGAWRRSLDPGGESQSPAVLPFSLWQSAWFPLGGSESHPEADADADGLSNAAEYASASNPLSASDCPCPVSTVTASGDQHITLRRRAGVSWILERSGDLVTWERAALSPTVTSQADGSELLTWEQPMDAAHRHCRGRVIIH